MLRGNESAWRLDFVDACYGAALLSDPSLLNPALELIASQVGAAMAVLQVMDRNGTSVRGLTAWGLPDEMLVDYDEHFSADDPCLKRFLSHDLQWARSTDACAEIGIRTVFGTRYSKQFWRRWGLRHPAGSFAQLDVDSVLSLGLPRHEGTGFLPPAHHDDLSFATTHLARVVSIQQRLSKLTREQELQQSVLDRLDFGILLVDHNGRIELSNHQSEALMQRTGPLTCRDGSLHFRDVQSGCSPLQRNEFDLQTPDPFVIRSVCGNRWVVFSIPWKRVTTEHWALLFFEEGRKKVDVGSALAALGNLTPAESAVIHLMLEGHYGHEIAERRQTGIETVRSQIKSVLQKLGLKRQTELMQLAARFSSPIRRWQ